jgi:hypothetical protein
VTAVPPSLASMNNTPMAKDHPTGGLFCLLNMLFWLMVCVGFLLVKMPDFVNIS